MYYKLKDGVLFSAPNVLSVTEIVSTIEKVPIVDEETNEVTGYEDKTVTTENTVEYQCNIPHEVYIKNGYYPLIKEFSSEDKQWWQDYTNSEYIVDNINCQISTTYSLVNKSLQEVKEKVLFQIDEFDNSDAVNSFCVNNSPLWLDKATRVGLFNLVNCAQLMNESTIKLTLNDQCFSVTLEKAKLMLATIEMYASKCYNVTALHKAQIRNAETIEEIISYDFTRGYPDNKPTFTL